MSQGKLIKYLLPAAVLLALFLALRFALPIILPFLLGYGVSFTADPLVRFLSQKARFPRPLAAFVSISIALLITGLSVVISCALLIRALGDLSGVMPDLESTALSGLHTLEGWLLKLTACAPESIQPVLSSSVERLFSGSSAIVDQLTGTALNFASSLFKTLPSSALSLGTWVLSSYMISARLPQIHAFFRNKLPPVWYQKYLPALHSLKKALIGWLIAQLKLSGITFCLLLAGFLILGISHSVIWALVVCLVDVLPVLGTGTVLVPWAFLCLLQGQQLQAVGLLSIYCVVSLSRSVLEPRLVGKQLGLDPLVTLLALYAGFRLWGILGMLAAPLLAVTATQLAGFQEK